MGQTSTDAELLDASQRGEMAAFGEIVERYQKLVCGVCFSATGDWALSEDVAQDTFVAAWAGLAKLREPARLAAWLCGIARNLSHKAIRRGRREVALETVEPIDERSPLDDAIDRETHEIVWRSLERIPERYREPLVLFYQEGQSAKAIASALGISEAAVHQRLSRGRKHLEQQVSSLVETTLSRHRPKKGFTAAVLAAIAAGIVVPDAEAATGGTTMMTMTKAGAAALAVGLLAAGWYASGDGSDVERERAAALEEQADVPAAVAPTVAATAPVPTDVVTKKASSPGVAAVRTSPPPGARRYGTYVMRGAKKDWADGRLGQIYDGCFEGVRTGKYEFAIDIGGEVRLVGGASLGAREDEVERCIRDETKSFGLEAKPGESVELDVSFEPRGELPAFDAELMKAIDLDTLPARGADDAKITMVVFVGFKCVFCGRLLGTIDQLLDEYPNDLRVVVRPYALHETDLIITEAAYAAQAQGKFWAMHDAMMADQDGLSAEMVRRYAKAAGLDLERFDGDMKARTFKEQVEFERDEAKAAGIRAVPTIVLGDERILGARPIEELRAKIDALK